MVVLATTAVVLAFYLSLQFVFVLSYGRRPPGARASPLPRVTILKPLAGNDDGLEDNLESFAQLDYPSFELLLGVAHDSDPALPIAQAFVRRHPEMEARVVRTNPAAASNPKVAQLLGMTGTGEVLLISDSNVRVAPDYLRVVAQGLSAPGVGLVTTLFAGTGEETMGAALENLQLGTMTTPGLLAVDLLSSR
ncbi:MAG: glycosyltransferase, partial [Myxococcales bacterium]